MKLLCAPTIESDVVWKARSLQFARTALCKRLGNLHSADDLILVILEHFLVGKHQAELDAEGIVAKFCNYFGDVTYLSPLGFLDANGDDVTDKMHQTAQLKNMCFLETKFELPLSRLGAPFPVYQRCNMIYWLHLPQSYPRKKKTAVENPPSVDSSAVTT